MNTDRETETEKAAQPYLSDPTDATFLASNSRKSLPDKAILFAISLFNVRRGEEKFTRATPATKTWPELVELLSTPEILAEKTDLLGWSPATFSDDYRTDKDTKLARPRNNSDKPSPGGYRLFENVQLVSLLGIDYELTGKAQKAGITKATTISEARAFWAPKGRGLLHTSYKHTSEFHRFRVVVPLSRPVTKEEHALIWARLLPELLKAGHVFDESASLDSSRYWYLVGHPQESAEIYQACHWEGNPLDVEALLLLPLPKETTTKAPESPIQTPKAPSRVQVTIVGRGTPYERARLYLETIPGAVSKQNGSNTTLYAACSMFRFGLSGSEVFSILWSDYNERCIPRWTAKDLQHKVDDAAKATINERGIKLLEEREESRITQPVVNTFSKVSQEGGPVAQVEEDKRPTRTQARAELGNTVRESRATPGQVTVLVSPTAAGKDTAVLDVVKEWSKEPSLCPVVILVPKYKNVWSLQLQAQIENITTKIFFSPPGEGGPRHQSGENKGSLKCVKLRSAVELAHAAGLSGHRTCAGTRTRCPEYNICEARPGFLGDENEALRIGVMHAPTLPLDGGKFLVINEWPELINNNEIPREGLKILAREYCGLEANFTEVFERVALALIEFLSLTREQQKTTDPLAPFKEELFNLCLQNDGNYRAELAVDPDYRPHQAKEKEASVSYVKAWQAASSILRAIIERTDDNKKFGYLKVESDGRLAWYGLTRIARAIRTMPNALILTATPGDFEELKQVTGKEVNIKEIAIKPTAIIERTLQESPSANHKSYFTDNGRGLPRWQKIACTETKKTSKSQLVQDIEDLTAYLEQRPEIKSLLIGSFKILAICLEILWREFQGETITQELLKLWADLHRGSFEKARPSRACPGRAALDRLFNLLAARSIRTDFTWYAGQEGLNDWRQPDNEFDACVTLGNAFPNLDQHRARFNLVRNLEPQDSSEAWQEAFINTAAGLQEQLHGRLGDCGRQRPAWHLHIGSVVPLGWHKEKYYKEPKRPAHRTKRKNPGERWQSEIKEAVAEFGSQAKLAKAWNVNKKTLSRFIGGTNHPDPQTLARFLDWSNAREDRLAREENEKRIPVSDDSITPLRIRSAENAEETIPIGVIESPTNTHIYTHNNNSLSVPLSSGLPALVATDGLREPIEPGQERAREADLEPDLRSAELIKALGEDAEERAAIYQQGGLNQEETEERGLVYDKDKVVLLSREEAEARVLVEFGGLSREDAEEITGLSLWTNFDRMVELSGTQSSPG